MQASRAEMSSDAGTPNDECISGTVRGEAVVVFNIKKPVATEPN
jgi:hypothetical protein